MSDTTQTDGAVSNDQGDEQTDVVEAVSEEVSETPSEQPAKDESLNFDELLSVSPKSSKEERGGLSRREHRELLDQTKEEPQQEEDPVLLAELREQRRLIEEMKQEQSMLRDRERSERRFKDVLAERGISESEFSSTYKDEFLQARDELLDEGMSFDKAIDFALRTVTPRVQAVEQKKREEGRKSTSLPPQSTGDPDTVVYKASSIYAKSFPQAKFNELKQLEAEGKVQIVYDI